MKKLFALTVTCLCFILTIAQSRVEPKPVAWSQDDKTAMYQQNQERSTGLSTKDPSLGLSREAEYPGGNQALLDYLSTRFEYPEKAVENGLEGTVRVRFTVNSEGRPINPEVTQSVHRSIDKEVVRLVREMPNWSPRITNGVPVSAIVEIPFALALR